MPSLPASRFTAAASRRASGRRPWSTVMATNFGPLRRRLRQSAASTSSAIESGPPETASARAGRLIRSANRRSASAASIGLSAADTLLFPLDRLLDARRCARIFAGDLTEGGAGQFFFIERGERLSQPQQR